MRHHPAAAEGKRSSPAHILVNTRPASLPTAIETDWRAGLPARYLAQVVVPRQFESHADAQAHARKVIGLDAQGQRCFLFHTHTVTEDRFDIDEFPLEVPVLRERQFAWRLASGEWLSMAERIDRLESCRPRCQRSGPSLSPGLPPGL